MSKKLKSFKGLIYVDDNQPGYSRKKHGRGFVYLDEKQKKVRDEKLLQRLKDLKIPPAWEKVWICKDETGYIQATGYDDKQRKQYLYHPDWEVFSQHEKYRKLQNFGEKLPSIRRIIEEDMKLAQWNRRKVLALVLRFMDEKYLRVGNRQYMEENETFGITTLRRKHLKEKENNLILEFKAKSGKYRKVNIQDPELVRLIKESSDMPGYELFRYLDSEGKSTTVESADVNDYLREISGEDFTSKTFRTWGGTVLAMKEQPGARKEVLNDNRKKLKTAIVKKVAKTLGNTTSIAERYYIHPEILEVIAAEDFEYKPPKSSAFSKNEIEFLDDQELKVLEILREKQG